MTRPIKELKKVGKTLGKHRWGERLKMSIFPVSEKHGHRISFVFKGKEYTFAGNDRMTLLDEAFEKIKSLQ